MSVDMCVWYTADEIGGMLCRNGSFQIFLKIRRHLEMASRKSIGTSDDNSTLLIHVISVEFTLHS